MLHRGAISWLDWLGYGMDLRVGARQRAPYGANNSNNDEDGKRWTGVYCLVYCPQTGTASKQGGVNLLLTENNTRYISQKITTVKFKLNFPENNTRNVVPKYLPKQHPLYYISQKITPVIFPIK